MSQRNLPLVAVVGRPNVGKSTFYNRVVPRGDSVVDDMPGVTRDRRESVASWTGVSFRLMDTGGLVPNTRDRMEGAILEQGNLALEDADVILFMVDAREGLTSVDWDIAQALRTRSDKVLVVSNKVESDTQELDATEGAGLGLGEPLNISAQHGRNMGDLLDEIVRRLPVQVDEEDPDDVIRVAVLGRPNVGKSSLVNRLLGEDRLLVHDEPGTTRDAVDVAFRYDNSEFILVDTAGLRRRSKVETGVEYYSTVRTHRSLSRCDVVLFVLEVNEPVTAQDLRIAGAITEARKSMVFVLNKWDLVTKVTGTHEAYVRLIRDKFPLLVGSPVVLISALTGQRVHKLPEVARELWEERRTRVPTRRLNDLLKEATDKVHPPMKTGRKPLKLYYMTQTGYEPPSFTVFVNDPQSAGPAYRKYLLNYFREALSLKATPVRLDLRPRR